MRRVLDYYLHTADVAGRLVLPYRDDPVLPAPVADVADGVRPDGLADHHQAMAWLIEEESTLLGLWRREARL